MKCVSCAQNQYLYKSFIHKLASDIRLMWSALPKQHVSCRGSVHNVRIPIFIYMKKPP